MYKLVKYRSRKKQPLLFNLLVGLILMLVLSSMVLTLLNSNKPTLDNINEAAGKTIFVDPTSNLQEIIDSTGVSDAIFFNPGEYLIQSPLKIRDKKIRILGSGEDYTIIRALNSTNKNNIIDIENSEITIQSLSIVGSETNGINVVGNSKLNIIETTVSRNSNSGIKFAGSNLQIQRSKLQDNGTGLEIENGNSYVYSTIIKNNAKDGILIKSTTNTKLQNLIIDNNKEAGVKIINGNEIEIKNVNLINNNIGLLEDNNTSKTTILNSIIQGNTTEGLRLNSNSTIKYSSFYRNGNTNITPQSLNIGEGNIFQDANFISSTDYRLSPNSPLKDKGIPTEFDNDGTRIDIGAFGGSNILPSQNNPPVVKSKPIEYIKPNQRYRYEIIAEDIDGDSLSYIVMNTLPNWLKLEKNILEGTPENKDIGFYGIIIVISDRKGGNTVHAININVLPTQASSPSMPTSSPIPTVTNIPVTNTVTPTPTIVIPRIQIISPKQDDILTPENNLIKWEIQPESTSIEKIKISYSSDGDKYELIKELPGSSMSYIWDEIENLVAGKYFIKIQAIDSRNPNLEIATISPQFEIQPKKATQTLIAITKNSPSDNDVVKDNKIQIVVEFKPEVELDKSQTRLIVAGQEVAYRTTKNTIYYQPAQPYNTTRVKVEVFLVTNDGATASKQWIFNIEENVNPADTNPEVMVRTQICIPGTRICIPQVIGTICIGIIVLLLLVLIMVFVIRIIKNIRDQRQGNIENEFSDFYGEQGIIENTSDNQKNKESQINTPTPPNETNELINYNDYIVPQNITSSNLDNTQQDQIVGNNIALAQDDTNLTNPKNNQIVNFEYDQNLLNNQLQPGNNVSVEPQNSNNTNPISSNQTDTTSNNELPNNQKTSEIYNNSNNIQTNNTIDDSEYIKSLMQKYGIQPKQNNDNMPAPNTNNTENAQSNKTT